MKGIDLYRLALVQFFNIIIGLLILRQISKRTHGQTIKVLGDRLDVQSIPSLFLIQTLYGKEG